MFKTKVLRPSLFLCGVFYWCHAERLTCGGLGYSMGIDITWCHWDWYHLCLTSLVPNI